ncbi:MAG: DUF5667 domain-containing protein [Candidatus Aenigmatarchaeota archaeon]
MKSPKIAQIVAIVLMAAILAVPVSAQEMVGEQAATLDFEDETVSEIELSVVEEEYNTTTDAESIGYPFKRLGEAISDFFTFDPDAKVRLRMQFAKERLAEANLMAARNRTQKALELIREYESELGDVQIRLRERIKIGANVSQLVKDAEVSTAKSALVLQLVLEKVPEQARTAIERAINNSLEKKARIRAQVEAIVGGELTDEQIQARIEERVRTRLASELEKHWRRIASLEERLAERVERQLTHLEQQIEAARAANRSEQAEALEAVKARVQEQAEVRAEVLSRMRERLQAAKGEVEVNETESEEELEVGAEVEANTTIQSGQGGHRNRGQ